MTLFRTSDQGKSRILGNSYGISRVGVPSLRLLKVAAPCWPSRVHDAGIEVQQSCKRWKRYRSSIGIRIKTHKAPKFGTSARGSLGRQAETAVILVISICCCFFNKIRSNWSEQFL